MLKRSFFALTFLALAIPAFAGETITVVANVLDSWASNRLLVLSGVDGRVYKVAKSREMRDQLNALTGRPVKLVWTEQVTDKGTELVLVSLAPVAYAEAGPISKLNNFTQDVNRSFKPTDVGSYQELEKIFNELDDTDKTRSQCFKRAHMWTFDMWSRRHIMSQKIFIFYTARYIQGEDFDWWFHVAPVVTAGGVDYAMDRTFMKKPVTVEDWKRNFVLQQPLAKNMTKTANCPYITHYDQYEKNQWNRLCYLRKMPMWYFRPADIVALDRKGVEKNGWDLAELQDARRAFKNGEDTYRGLDTGAPTVNH